MSKTNEKTQGLAPATAAPAGPSNLAVVQSSSAAEADQVVKTIHQGEAVIPKPKDEYRGLGGLYRMVGGVRTRVAFTKPADTQNTDGKEAKQ